ncbi:hypothetical protein CON22_24920 [Bacillus cereus]|nr:hypothetical protein CON22_24920 [Bacillus cereus]
MKNILRIVFSLASALLAIYSLISNDFKLIPLILICLGISNLIQGISDFREGRKPFAYTYFPVTIPLLFVRIYI